MFSRRSLFALLGSAALAPMGAPAVASNDLTEQSMIDCRNALKAAGGERLTPRTITIFYPRRYFCSQSEALSWSGMDPRGKFGS